MDGQSWQEFFLHAQYAAFYNAHPDLQIQPQLTMGPDIYYEMNRQPQEDVIPRRKYTNQGERFAQWFGAYTDVDDSYMYVPPNFVVVFDYITGNNNYQCKVYPGYVDRHELKYEDGTAVFPAKVLYNITTVQFLQYASIDWSREIGDASSGDVKYAACLSEIPMFIGNTVLSTLRPQGPYCDAFFLKECKDATSPYYNKLGCSCIREEKVLEETYPNARPQVTCLGATCGLGGYYTNAMAREKCSVAYCAEFLSINGANAYIGANSLSYCAGSSWSLATPPEPTVPIETTIYVRRDERSTPFYIWLIFALGLAVAALLAFLILRDPIRRVRAARA